MKTWLRWVVLALPILLAIGCGGVNSSAPDAEKATSTTAASTETSLSLLDPTGNFTLYVSNQSSEVNPVDITVAIDGQVLVDKSFEVGSGHNYDHIVLRLPPGTHTLVAYSEKGEARVERSFEVTDEQTAFVDYVYHSGAHGTPAPRQMHFWTFEGVTKPF